MLVESTSGYVGGSTRRGVPAARLRKHVTAGKSVDHTDSLPPELRAKIASMLADEDLGRLKTSNKKWMETVNDVNSRRKAERIAKQIRTIKTLWSNPEKWKGAPMKEFEYIENKNEDEYGRPHKNHKPEFKDVEIRFHATNIPDFTEFEEIDGSNKIFKERGSLPSYYGILEDYNQKELVYLTTQYTRDPFRIIYTIISGFSPTQRVHMVDLYWQTYGLPEDQRLYYPNWLNDKMFHQFSRACELCDHSGKNIETIDSIYYKYVAEGDHTDDIIKPDGTVRGGGGRGGS